jgi:hypothetical protein
MVAELELQRRHERSEEGKGKKGRRTEGWASIEMDVERKIEMRQG